MRCQTLYDTALPLQHRPVGHLHLGVCATLPRSPSHFFPLARWAGAGRGR